MGHHVPVRCCLLFAIALGHGSPARAQTKPPPPEPPRLWETQVGASFVGTSGNTDTTTVGADLSLNRRWPKWEIESTAAALRTTTDRVDTAKRYLAAFSGKRQLTAILDVSTGERVERDQLAGIDFRSVFDGGLGWALVRAPRWTVRGLTSLAWSRENLTSGPERNRPVGVFQAVSRLSIGATGSTTQRVTYFPDFKDSSAYRAEAEVTAQATLNSRLALKLGYLFRYSNAPVPGFGTSDNTTTASLVIRWRASELAP